MVVREINFLIYRNPIQNSGPNKKENLKKQHIFFINNIILQIKINLIITLANLIFLIKFKIFSHKKIILKLRIGFECVEYDTL